MSKQIKQVFTTKPEQASVEALGYKDLDADIEDLHPRTLSCLLHDAIIHGKLEIVKKLAEEKIDLNCIHHSDHESYAGMRSLHIAVYCQQWEIVSLLLEKGVDPNATDNLGKTPLMLAAIEGDETAINLLLSHDKVDMNKENPKHDFYFDMTALAYAAYLNRVNIAKLLLAKGAKQVTVHNHGERNFLSYFTLESAKKEMLAYLETQQLKQDNGRQLKATLPHHSFIQKKEFEKKSPAKTLSHNRMKK